MNKRRLIRAILAGAISICLLGLIIGGLREWFGIQLPTASVGVGGLVGFLAYSRDKDADDSRGDGDPG